MSLVCDVFGFMYSFCLIYTDCSI